MGSLSVDDTMNWVPSTVLGTYVEHSWVDSVCLVHSEARLLVRVSDGGDSLLERPDNRLDLIEQRTAIDQLKSGDQVGVQPPVALECCWDLLAYC